MGQERTYERTHPWLSFLLDVRRFTPRLWMLLAEAESKCERIAVAPTPPLVTKRLHRVYLAKGVMATTAIEGNTLTEEEVNAILEGRSVAPPSKKYQEQEIRNVQAALSDIWRDLEEGESAAAGHWTDAVCAYNATVLRSLPPSPAGEPGSIRTTSVGVGRYRGAPHQDCSFLLRRLGQWMNEGFPEDAFAGRSVVKAIVQAVVGHLYLAWIHPFADGNGRTARLVEFRTLVAAGIPTPACHLLSNHYNATRAEYYRQLDRASRSGGDVVPFLEYAAQGFVDQLREQLQFILGVQLNVAWRDYVYEFFRDRDKTAARRRQRQLLLALSDSEGPVPRRMLRVLTKELAKLYDRKTSKTLTRDLNALKSDDLVERREEGYVACKERILGFLPRRHVEV